MGSTDAARRAGVIAAARVIVAIPAKARRMARGSLGLIPYTMVLRAKGIPRVGRNADPTRFQDADGFFYIAHAMDQGYRRSVLCPQQADGAQIQSLFAVREPRPKFFQARRKKLRALTLQLCVRILGHQQKQHLRIFGWGHAVYGLPVFEFRATGDRRKADPAACRSSRFVQSRKGWGKYEISVSFLSLVRCICIYWVTRSFTPPNPPWSSGRLPVSCLPSWPPPALFATGAVRRPKMAAPPPAASGRPW